MKKSGWERARSFMRCVPGVLLLACLFCASASANLPRLSSELIVPFQSIGGISIGESYPAASAAWGTASGGTSSCSKGSNCSFDTENQGHASFDCYHGHVVHVHIAFSTDVKGHAMFVATPLASLKTAKGIGLGSAFRQLVAAYPGGTVESIFGGEYEYKIIGPREIQTQFALNGNKPTSRITFIDIYKPNPG